MEERRTVTVNATDGKPMYDLERSRVETEDGPGQHVVTLTARRIWPRPVPLVELDLAVRALTVDIQGAER